MAVGTIGVTADIAAAAAAMATCSIVLRFARRAAPAQHRLARRAALALKCTVCPLKVAFSRPRRPPMVEPVVSNPRRRPVPAPGRLFASRSSATAPSSAVIQMSRHACPVCGGSDVESKPGLSREAWLFCRLSLRESRVLSRSDRRLSGERLTDLTDELRAFHPRIARFFVFQDDISAIAGIAEDLRQPRE